MSGVLVFRIGSLGDTVMALPALWAVRRHFAGSKLTLLGDVHPGKNLVSAGDLLRETGIFDEFIGYPVALSGPRSAWKPLDVARLGVVLRRKRFGTLVYLAPSNRLPSQVRRDRAFFRLAGIRTFIGMDGFRSISIAPWPRPLPRLPSESDLLLERLAVSGIAVPPPECVRFDLGLGPRDIAAVDEWRSNLPDDGGRPWIAVGPGSKMPAKKWPLERYAHVGELLQREFDVWPVVVGGPEDAAEGRRLVEFWGRGYNAAGGLGLRPSAEALRRCLLYVGNDTGSMHLAASAGVRCVAVFSARVPAGWWYPLGEGHRALQVSIDCEGCELQECVERRMECVMRIRTQDVVDACGEILRQVLESRAARREGGLEP